ncbi:LysE family translocator [Pandoraea commovens]|uniref:Amino acid transporter n=1 Tax=Pandoraea commovens TaxID=2508289 RepID=A0A5E4XDT6_9BURK|nr:LysE family translocator [Pandoraea commovens]UVA81109.1 LysE family translocator [Pandoraea commovens]VVE34457.1 amino acid transporter [Pandoraea commovens]
MVDWSAVVTVFGIYMVAVVIPGPNFVAITHKAVTGGRADALALVAGIVTVNLFWATCAMLGLGAVFAVFPWLAVGVKLVGAAYLVWFGLRLVVSARATPSAESHPPKALLFRGAFVQGIATNIANPKSIAFYAAVFSSAVPTHVSTPTFFAMLATVGASATCWYGAVALVLSHASIATAYRRVKAWIDLTCGGLMIALGIRQALR